VAPGSVAPSDWTPYRVNTLPPGTTSTLLTGLTASTAYIVGVAFRDRVANVAMTPVTATFTTAGVTTGTADVPAGLVIVDGVNDVNVPQGVVLGLYASVGASSIVVERAPNLTSGATDYPGTYAEIAVLPATAETYVDYLPKDGTKYWYRIKHRTPGKADSNPIPQRLFISVGSTVYAGLQAVATGVPSSITRPSAAAAIITPTSLYDDAGPFLKQLLVRLQYTDVQSRIVYYEYRSRERIKKTWGAWTAWSGPLYRRTDLTYMQADVTLNNTSYIYEVEWRVYGADGEGGLSYILNGVTEWPQNYGQNKPIIKVQKQGYNAGSSKYEVWWRFYFDRGNSTLDEDGDDNTQQTFTTQVIAASVKDQNGTTATNVVTSGTKTADGWKATWDSTAGQSWVFEVSVDTAMPTQYYLQYQDTDVLDEQLVAPTSGQTFSAPAASATATTGTLTLGSYLTGGSYNGSANVTTTVDATTTNTASKVVARDASGNFSAGTITATLNGAAPAGSLTGTTLASNVVNSSLTSVGTLTGLTVSGASTLFNTGDAVGTLTLGTTAAVTQEQRFRLTNSVATGGVEIVLNGAATSWGLYDRTASKWAIQVARGATDAVSIPGSLAVTNALSTSSTFSASSYAAVGGAVSANAQLYVRGTMVGTGVNQYSALVQATFPVAATSGMHGVFVATIGAAGTYTTTNVIGVNVQPHTLGAGQTVTNAYSVFIGASSHAATTKYGIQIGDVTGGTTNYALYTGTGQVRFGGAVSALSSLTVSGDLTVDTNTLKVDSTNNRVGVGTASPAYTLDSAGYINGTYLLRATRSADQRIDIDCGGPSYPTANGIVSFSNPANSKTLVIRATTDAANTTRTTGSLGIDFQTYASSRLFISEFGNVGVATSSPEGQVDIPWSGTPGKPTILLGATDGGSTRTNATRKNFRIGAYHYTNASLPFAILMGDADASSNEVRIGGGTGLLNAATSIVMLTGATTTTPLGSERMRIVSNGNVGIGTASPATRLDINGTTTFRDTLFLSSEGILSWSSDLGNGQGGAILGSVASKGVLIRGGASGTGIFVNSSNNVGIGTTSPSERLHVSGNILATQNVTAYSDARVKANIEVIGNALAKVRAIRGVTFTRTDTHDSAQRYAGVIAQEIEAVLPEVVGENGAGMKHVAYGNIVSLLIEAVKELADIVESRQ